MTVQDIIKKKPYLAWDVKDPSVLSEKSVLEHVLNNGDWDDVQMFCRVMGKEKTAQLFNKSLQNKRTNYKPSIKAYFIRYFNK